MISAYSSQNLFLKQMQTKEQLQERAQLVRIHEANCQIDFPSPEEANFRIAVMKQLGRELGLKEVRTAAITGPAASVPSRPAPSALKVR
jgi:hypothetical protein